MLAGGEDGAQRKLAAAFRLEILVAVAARVPVVGAVRIIVLDRGAVDRIGQGGRAAVDGRAVQFRHRRRAEAPAGRAAQQQRGAWPVGQADLRTGGAPHFFVMVVARRQLRFPLFRKRHQHFAVQRGHVAAVAGGAAAFGRGVIVDVVAQEQGRRCKHILFAARFAADGHGQLTARHRHQGARKLEVDRVERAARAAHHVVDLDAVDQRLAFGARRTEGIDAAIGDPFEELVVQHITVGVAVLDRVDAVVVGGVVVPAADGAREAHDGAHAFAGEGAGALAGFVQAHAQFEFAGEVVVQLIETRASQLRHARVVEVARHARRRAGVVGLGAAERHFGISLVRAAQLDDAAAEQAGFFGLRIQLGVAHIVIGAGVDAARAVRQVDIGRRRAARHRQVDQAVRDRLSVDREADLLQMVALGRRQADIGRAGVAREQVTEALFDLQVGNEAALRGIERIGALEVGHGKDIVAIAFEHALAGAEAGGALAGAAFIGRADIHVRFQPLEILARDEVDDAADRIGAVQRRGAVEQHFDAFERGGRDVVQVDAAVVAGRGEVGHAPAIEQHQCGRGADAAQVGAVEAPLVAADVDAGAVGQAIRVGRHAAQEFGGRGHARFFDLGARDGLHR